MSLPARVGQTTTIRGYHKPHGKPYAYGSTLPRLQAVARDGFDLVDLDLTLDRDGNGYVNHSAQPMLKDAWRDPIRKSKRMDHRKGIRSMTPAQARRLVSPWGHIMSMGWAIKVCARLGMFPMVEAKGKDPRFFSVAWWRRFKARQQGRPFAVAALPGSGRAGVRKLKAAHAAGIPTVWLYRGPVPAEVLEFVTFVKRGRKWTRKNPDPA